MNEQKFTRKELYDLVWSTPMSTILKKYFISTDRLRGACKRMNIPLPQQGYWLKLKFNKPVDYKELSEKFEGEKEFTLQLKKEGDNMANAHLSALAYYQQKIISEVGEKLKVPGRLTDPCDLIINEREAIKELSHYDYRSGRERVYQRKLNIQVSDEQTGRALRFMDTFIKVMRDRGHKITFDDGFSFVVIQDEKFRIRCSEKYNKIPKPKTGYSQDYDYVPTGIFLFTVVYNYGRTFAWKDGKTSIEAQLANIIAKLELKGEELKKERIEWEIAHEIAQEKRRIQEEIERQIRLSKQKEVDGFKKLRSDSNRWHEAEIIRDFIKKKEAYAKANNAYTKEIEDEILWAREKANWVDPFIASEDKHLGYFEKSVFSSQSNKVI